MSKRKITYFIGRLNLIANFYDKFDFLHKCISSGKIVKSGRGKYRFGIFDIEEISIDQKKYLIGTLTKFVPIDESEKVNIEKGKIETDESQNDVIAKSNFVLHPESGFIAFNPIGTTISHTAFMTKFSEIIIKSDILIHAEIQIISDEFEVFTALKEFEIINDISLSLHPSNPNMRDIWKDIDEDLHKLNVDSYRASYKSKRGLEVERQSKVYSEIAMASDGYGKAKIQGIKDNKKKVASTDKIPVKCEVSEDDASKISEIIIKKFKKLWERMSK